MLKSILVAASLVVCGTAIAEETTIIKRDSEPGVGVVVSPSASETRSTTVTTSSGCDTKVIHKENDMGDSKTIKKTEC